MPYEPLEDGEFGLDVNFSSHGLSDNSCSVSIMLLPEVPVLVELILLNLCSDRGLWFNRLKT